MLKTIPEEISKSLPFILTDSQNPVMVYLQPENAVLFGINYGPLNREVSPRILYKDKMLKLHQFPHSTRKGLILLPDNSFGILNEKEDIKTRLAYFGMIQEAFEEFEKEGFGFYRGRETYANVWKISDKNQRINAHKEFAERAKQECCSLQDVCKIGEELTKEQLLEILVNNQQHILSP